MTDRTPEQALDEQTERIEKEWAQACAAFQKARESCASQFAFQAIFAFRQGRRKLADRLANLVAVLGFLLVYRPNSRTPWILVPERAGPRSLIERLTGRRRYDYDNAAKLAPGGGDDPSKEWNPTL